MFIAFSTLPFICLFSCLFSLHSSICLSISPSICPSTHHPISSSVNRPSNCPFIHQSSIHPSAHPSTHAPPTARSHHEPTSCLCGLAFSGHFLQTGSHSACPCVSESLAGRGEPVLWPVPETRSFSWVCDAPPCGWAPMLLTRPSMDGLPFTPFSHCVTCQLFWKPCPCAVASPRSDGGERNSRDTLLSPSHDLQTCSRLWKPGEFTLNRAPAASHHTGQDVRVFSVLN